MSNEYNRCAVANPGGVPCTKEKGHQGGRDPEAYGPSNEHEERLKQIRRNRELSGAPFCRLPSWDDVNFLLSLIDSHAADSHPPLTGVIADIATREGVLDGWHEEVVLITPDERDDLGREWSALTSQLERLKQQFELLDDPQGLYSEAKSAIESIAATRMREACVAKVREMRDSYALASQTQKMRAADEILTDIQSLTLDNVEQEK